MNRLFHTVKVGMLMELDECGRNARETAIDGESHSRRVCPCFARTLCTIEHSSRVRGVFPGKKSLDRSEALSERR